MLAWYKQRCAIEVYFKILKSDKNLENSKLRERKRIERWIAIFTIVGWRIFWMTMMARQSTKLPESFVFNDTECLILRQTGRLRKDDSGVKIFLYALAKLGGYLDRAIDPPGNTVVWRGIRKLNELRQGYEIAVGVNVGNGMDSLALTAAELAERFQNVRIALVIAAVVAI